jgi:hypothetical protein
MDATDQFIAAFNVRDLEAVAQCLHPDIQMVVPPSDPLGASGAAARSRRT